LFYTLPLTPGWHHQINTERRFIDMLKRRLIAVAIALILTTAVAGASTVVADALGLTITPLAQACQNGGGSGGGC
jgi:hypothetical protein